MFSRGKERKQIICFSAYRPKPLGVGAFREGVLRTRFGHCDIAINIFSGLIFAHEQSSNSKVCLPQQVICTIHLSVPASSRDIGLRPDIRWHARIRNVLKQQEINRPSFQEIDAIHPANERSSVKGREKRGAVGKSRSIGEGKGQDYRDGKHEIIY
jgi:hypothetical protein